MLYCISQISVLSTSRGGECFIKIISIYEGNSSCHRSYSLCSSCWDADFHGRGFLRHRHLKKGQNGSRLGREKVSCTAVLGEPQLLLQGFWRWGDPAKLLWIRARQPGLCTPCSLVFGCGSSLERSMALDKVDLVSWTNPRRGPTAEGVAPSGMASS